MRDGRVVLAGGAAPRHPCPYYDSEPLAGPPCGHCKGGGGRGWEEGTLVVAQAGDALTYPTRKKCVRERERRVGSGLAHL